MALSGSVKTSTYDGRGLQLSWTAKQSVANNTSTISWTLKPFGGNVSWYTTGPITLKINGTTVYSTTDRIDMWSSWSKSGSLTIAHNNDGTKTFAVSIQAAIYYSTVNCTGSANFTLNQIARTPSAPTACSITAGHGSLVGLGDTITIKWSGASGVITGYEVQASRGNSGWISWSGGYTTGTTLTDSFATTNINQSGAGCAVQYRVRAKNGTLASGWKTSNTLTISGAMKLKVSGAWKTGSTWIKVGGTWKRAKRVWVKINGTWKQA